MPTLANGQLYINKTLIVFYGNRHVPGSGAYDEDGEYYRSDLTVTSVLKNSAGTVVTGSAATLSLKALNEPDRNGVYEGTMVGTITLTENADYYLEITVADSGATRLDFVRIHYVARYEDGQG
jgi:hypothetical protein